MSMIRCVSRSLRFATRPLVLSPQAQTPLLRRRHFADEHKQLPARHEPEIEPNADNLQNEFAGHALSAFKDMRKVVLFIAYGGLIVGSVAGIFFEAAHFWIEGQMQQVADDDAKRWGWDIESWSDVETGGTSPVLGIAGRHAVRAAWFSLRYGKHFTTTTSISQVGDSRVDHGNLNIVDASLESARVYLELAMARVQDDQGRMRMDSVGIDLLERHASVMERLGSQIALIKARNEYILLFQSRAGNPLAMARLAVKVGDICERLGDDKGALLWWTQGVDLTKDSTRITPSSTPLSPLAAMSSRKSQPVEDNNSTASEDSLSTLVLPEQPPSSPAAQRTLVAAMLSLSAHYSKRKQLREAQNVQEYAIQLINAMVPLPESSPLANRVDHSLGQTLHQMFLLHRKSLLEIHHGEVTFALTSSTKTRSSPHTAALMDLLTAASSSEVVAQILTGLPISHPDLPSTYPNPKPDSASAPQPSRHISHPPSSNSPLLPAYQGSPALSAPAGSVLRDARLAAAEAWDLCGVLYSDMGGEDMKALECFERALGWVGEDPTQSESREGIGAKEWQALWGRFVEAREKVLGKSR